MALSTQGIDTWTPRDLAVQLAHHLVDDSRKRAQREGRAATAVAQERFYAAWPYIEILTETDDWDGRVGPAREAVSLQVAYLLNNLTTWRGETAREFKRVLRARIGH